MLARAKQVTCRANLHASTPGNWRAFAPHRDDLPVAAPDCRVAAPSPRFEAPQGQFPQAHVTVSPLTEHMYNALTQSFDAQEHESA
jgi:hypothetical protein